MRFWIRIELLPSAPGNLIGHIIICVSCKKIRYDEGYWSEIERYVGEHSEAQFSHSVCPDCMRKLYPEYADEVLDRLEKDKKNREDLCISRL